jgi:hypothetical protein
MKRRMTIFFALLLALALTGAVYAGGGGEATETETTAGGMSNLEKSLAVDTTGLKSEDGQPLIILQEKQREVPARPRQPLVHWVHRKLPTPTKWSSNRSRRTGTWRFRTR